MAAGFGAIPGLRIGHAQDEAALTGCTVFLCPQGAVAACEVRVRLVSGNWNRYALATSSSTFTGWYWRASAFGLDAASGGHAVV